ncbi:MAG: choice-of-anchor I family protein [Parvibaculum sp.]
MRIHGLSILTSLGLFSGAILLPGTALAEDELRLHLLGTYETQLFDKSAAEISAFAPSVNRLYVVNADAAGIDILDLSDPAKPSKVNHLSFAKHGASVNSVAVFGDLVAVAVAGDKVEQPGKVIFLSLEGEEKAVVTVGANPDMVAFTHDGAKLVVANEGEPSDDYTVDPEGSISIITIADMKVAHVDFARFDDVPAGMRIVKPGASLAADLEPEYVGISRDNKTAYVTLQENNGIAVVDLESAEVTSLIGLGYKDHSIHAMDASNKDGGRNIRTWPVKGMYQPDAIAVYEVAGKTYLVTANEGDARDYDGWSEEAIVADITLDETAFPNAEEIQAEGALGKLKTTTTMGDTDGDGDHDEIYAFGARSFSIWSDSGELIYDSGDDFERITSKRLGDNFNSNNDENESGDKRSDDKGPEPEGVVLGEIAGRTIAFIGLERVGGVMSYDVTDPRAPRFLGYENNRNWSGSASAGKAGDLGPEGLTFIPSNQSPTGRDMLVVTNEVSGTTSIFEVGLN